MWTGNPAAEWTSYFFINKITNIQSFIVLRLKKCVKLVNKRENLFNLGIKHSTRILVQTLKPFFAKFCCRFLAFSSFHTFLPLKTLKMQILTRDLGVQHPNTV